MQAARPSTLRAISVLLMGTFFAQSPAQANDAPKWTGELPIRASWLRDHLPESAVVYARIPHPFGLLSMPKGNSIDAALRSASNIDNVERIRRGITENVLEQIPAFADIQLRLLEQHIRSPVEVAALFSGAPEALISVNLSFESMQTFDEALQLNGKPH